MCENKNTLFKRVAETGVKSSDFKKTSSLVGKYLVLNLLYFRFLTSCFVAGLEDRHVNLNPFRSEF